VGIKGLSLVAGYEWWLLGEMGGVSVETGVSLECWGFYVNRLFGLCLWIGWLFLVCCVCFLGVGGVGMGFICLGLGGGVKLLYFFFFLSWCGGGWFFFRGLFYRWEILVFFGC